MERIGAVGRLKDSDSVVLAWAYNLSPQDVKDTTGAGDAFAAGLARGALDSPIDDDAALMAAMRRGSLWGAYACTTLGGAKDCPSGAQLQKFARSVDLVLETQAMPLAEAQPTLRLIDRIFQ